MTPKAKPAFAVIDRLEGAFRGVLVDGRDDVDEVNCEDCEILDVDVFEQEAWEMSRKGRHL